MARGRRPVPGQAKVLRGNFRRDRDTHGPKVASGLPPCPKWLPRLARRHWAELAPKLAEAGLLSAVDGDVFAAHCHTVALFAEVTEALRTIEDSTEVTAHGELVISALFAIRAKLHEQLLKGAREFGMTPGARSAIRAPAQQQLDLGGWDEL